MVCPVRAYPGSRWLGASVLPAVLLACSRSFLDVSVLPSSCTTSSPASKPSRCGDPARFGWAYANARIEYPPVLAQAGVSGRVTALLWVGASGTVDSMKITSTSHALFSIPVERGLRGWRFKSSGSSAARSQGALPVDILFKPGGCPDPNRLEQRVVALHTGILVEVVACGVVLMRSVS